MQHWVTFWSNSVQTLVAMTSSLQHRKGSFPVLLVAPHATAELEEVGPFIQGWPNNKLEVGVPKIPSALHLD